MGIYIIISLSILAGRYVNMSVWMLTGIVAAGWWGIRQLKEAREDDF